MGLIVIGNESKSENFMKLQCSEIAYFVDKVSGNKKHIHDFFVSCVYRAVEAVKEGKKCKKKSIKNGFCTYDMGCAK
jgi:hypothetical protein